VAHLIGGGGHGGSAHCYNGNVIFLWKKANFNPGKIETIEQIVSKFVTCLCRIEEPHSKVGKKSVYYGLLDKRVKYTFL